MDFLRTLVAGRLLAVRPIHIGSGDPAKGRFSRDFAAVMAQTTETSAILVFCPQIQSNTSKASAIE
jgi:hypothetical protein